MQPSALYSSRVLTIAAVPAFLGLEILVQTLSSEYTACQDETRGSSTQQRTGHGVVLFWTALIDQEKLTPVLNEQAFFLTLNLADLYRRTQQTAA